MALDGGILSRGGAKRKSYYDRSRKNAVRASRERLRSVTREDLLGDRDIAEGGLNRRHH